MGSLKLEGAGDPRARSGARRATGHGARGGARGVCAAWRGTGRRRARLTHAASTQPAAPTTPRQPGLVLAKDGLQTHMHSLGDVSPVPPPAGRPWRRSAPKPALRSRGKTKGQSSRTAAAGKGISTSQNSSRVKSKSQVEEGGSCDTVGKGWLRTCHEAGRPQVRDPLRWCPRPLSAGLSGGW